MTLPQSRRKQCTYAGIVTISLTKCETAIVTMLLIRRGLVTRWQDIADMLWDGAIDGGPLCRRQSVNRHMEKLRDKMPCAVRWEARGGWAIV